METLHCSLGSSFLLTWVLLSSLGSASLLTWVCLLLFWDVPSSPWHLVLVTSHDAPHSPSIIGQAGRRGSYGVLDTTHPDSHHVGGNQEGRVQRATARERKQSATGGRSRQWPWSPEPWPWVLLRQPVHGPARRAPHAGSAPTVRPLTPHGTRKSAARESLHDVIENPSCAISLRPLLTAKRAAWRGLYSLGSTTRDPRDHCHCQQPIIPPRSLCITPVTMAEELSKNFETLQLHAGTVYACRTGIASSFDAQDSRQTPRRSRVRYPSMRPLCVETAMDMSGDAGLTEAVVYFR